LKAPEGCGLAALRRLEVSEDFRQSATPVGAAQSRLLIEVGWAKGVTVQGQSNKAHEADAQSSVLFEVVPAEETRVIGGGVAGRVGVK
jgi:hypothetical protein